MAPPTSLVWSAATEASGCLTCFPHAHTRDIPGLAVSRAVGRREVASPAPCGPVAEATNLDRPAWCCATLAVSSAAFSTWPSFYIDIHSHRNFSDSLHIHTHRDSQPQGMDGPGTEPRMDSGDIFGPALREGRAMDRWPLCIASGILYCLVLARPWESGTARRLGAKVTGPDSVALLVHARGLWCGGVGF